MKLIKSSFLRHRFLFGVFSVILCCSFSWLSSQAYASGPLENLLRETLKGCVADPGADETEGELFTTEVLPSKGYATSRGSMPPCGCGCAITTAAYADPSGGFTTLTHEEFDCGNVYTMKSNRDLDKLFSGSIREAFSKKAKVEGPGVFYLFPELPKNGTKTKIRLKYLLNGLETTCPGGICSDVISSGVKEKYYQRELNVVHAFLKGQEAKTPDVFYKMREENQEAYRKSLEKEGLSDSDFQRFLGRQSRAYEMYLQIQFSAIDFDWDRKTRTFIVLKKHRLNHDVFSKFLGRPFWGPTC